MKLRAIRPPKPTGPPPRWDELSDLAFDLLVLRGAETSARSVAALTKHAGFPVEAQGKVEATLLRMSQEKPLPRVLLTMKGWRTFTAWHYPETRAYLEAHRRR